MLPEIGHFCLILALCLSLVQAFIFISTLVARNTPFAAINIFRLLALGQVFFVLFSSMFLFWALVSDDFSVVYVANNSNSSLPIYYKLTAFWGAHEGSLLLWVVILNIWMLAVALASRSWITYLRNTVLAIMGLVNCGFLLLLLMTSNPFVRNFVDIPLDGADLNPMLQDFGMIVHPPILYFGYVGSTVAFAFAIAALLAAKVDQSWARMLRPWVLLAWISLTLGIALGSWWAYYELGWGGWWFWDPVENASFMPWLTGTALLHCLVVAEKKGSLLRLALFLSVVTFALSLLGTFIVRSGVISSVHAFVSDPQRGMFILQFLAITIGGALLLYVQRASKLQLPQAARLEMLSTEGAIVGNNVILLIAAATVLLGTLYPLMYDVFTGNKISVGYPYFNAVFVPIIFSMLFILLPTILPNRKKLLISAALSIVISILFLSLFFSLSNFNAGLGLCLALAIIINSIWSMCGSNVRLKLPMTIAHIGLAVSIIGVSIVTAYEVERDLSMRVGEVIAIKNYAIKFNAVTVTDGPNFIGYQGDFTISKNHLVLASLFPEKRLYLAQELPMSETAIFPGLFSDIYITLGQKFNVDTWSVRIYYKPFVRWIWLGAIIMALGALCSLIQRAKSYVK